MQPEDVRLHIVCITVHFPVLGTGHPLENLRGNLVEPDVARGVILGMARTAHSGLNAGGGVEAHDGIRDCGVDCGIPEVVENMEFLYGTDADGDISAQLEVYEGYFGPKKIAYLRAILVLDAGCRFCHTGVVGDFISVVTHDCPAR